MNDHGRLQLIIDRCMDHLDAAPDGNLPRGMREALWCAFGPWRSPDAWKRRARLAIATANAVRHVWQIEHAGSDYIDRALSTAEAIVAGTFTGDAKEAAYRIGAEFIELPGNDEALPAAWAASKALYVAAFDESFDEDPDPLQPDRADIPSNDTAFFAAWALSGSRARAHVDVVARREFWRWWLTEAVPAAYNSESEDAQ